MLFLRVSKGFGHFGKCQNRKKPYVYIGFRKVFVRVLGTLGSAKTAKNLTFTLVFVSDLGDSNVSNTKENEFKK